MSERLHKLLAQHGLGSRREIEKWMLAGRVMLNNKPAQPGDRYIDGDRVSRRRQGRHRAAAGSQRRRRSRLSQAARSADQSRSSTDADGSRTSTKPSWSRLPPFAARVGWSINTMQAGDSGLLLLTSDGRLADALRRRAERFRRPTSRACSCRIPSSTPNPFREVVQYDDETVEFERIEPPAARERIDGSVSNRTARIVVLPCARCSKVAGSRSAA